MNNFKWLPETIRAIGPALFSIIIIESAICIPFTAFLLRGGNDKVIFWSLFIPWILTQIITVAVITKTIKETAKEFFKAEDIPKLRREKNQ